MMTVTPEVARMLWISSELAKLGMGRPANDNIEGWQTTLDLVAEEVREDGDNTSLSGPVLSNGTVSDCMTKGSA